MARGVPFAGMNTTINPPPGDEGTVSELALFRSKGGANVSCWELDDRELADVARSGRFYVSVFSGQVFFPIFAGSEREVQRIVADTGPTFARDDTHAARPSRSAIAFTLSRAVVNLAAVQDAGIELEVDGPDRIKAHVVAGDVEGVVPITLPIDIARVRAMVDATREFLHEPDRNAANSCGVFDSLHWVEAWLEAAEFVREQTA